MNTTVADAIAADLATLEQVVDAAEEPFGYGTDLWCEADLHPDMIEVDGGTVLALAQAVVRRLDCPRGALPDDPDYGFDVRRYANRATPAREVGELAGRIRTEVLKDDRVDRATVVVTPTPSGSSLTIDISVTPVAAELGGFSLTLAATSAEVVLDAIRRTA